MDPKSEWALGDFREAALELRILDAGSVSSSGTHQDGNNTVRPEPVAEETSEAGRRETTAAAEGGEHLAYQGERLSGLLVVKLDPGSDGDERRDRWRKFGKELNVELEITTEAVGTAGTALMPEEPSLWRDYEGRENARDKGVLTRSNRRISLDLTPPVVNEKAGEMVYALDVEVQVPVEHLGQAVALEALVTPTPRSQRGHENPFPASHNASASGGGGGGVGSSSDYNSGASGSGQGGGGGSGKGGGGDFANRLDGLFALSRAAPVRLPVKRCSLPLQVVQPITVTSRSSPSSHAIGDAAPISRRIPPGAGNTASFPGTVGRCLIALEIRNEHPTATVTVHDVEVHVDATARFGERASSLGFSAPGKAGGSWGAGGRGGGGGGGGIRRKMAGGAPGGSSSAPLEGLERSIEQPPLAGASTPGSLARVFSASWIAKPSLPLKLAPGEVQGFVVVMAPVKDTLPPRRAGGRFESPVTFVWSLHNGGNNDADDATRDSSAGLPRLALSRSLSSPSEMVPSRRTTSVYLAQWQVEQRGRDEVLLRVIGQAKVKLNRVFEVSLRVRNLSPGARDLVVMFTESEADVGHLSLEGIRPMRGPARLGGGGGGSGSFGASDMDDDGDGGVAKDISPVPSPRHAGRSSGGFSTSTSGGGGGVTGDLPPPPPYPGPAAAHTLNSVLRAVSSPAAASAAAAAAATALGDLLPIDAAVPLGRLEKGAERGATVRLTAARAGLARLSTLCLRDTLTGAVYTPACPYEVYVEG